MNGVKIMSTVYPSNQPTEKEWMKEFKVGRLFFDQPNNIGVTYGEYIMELKRETNVKTNKQVYYGQI